MTDQDHEMLVTQRQMELIGRHLQLMLDVNETINLTSIVSEDEARLLHIQDSLSALPEMNAAPVGLYGDMGTGGGYPGIPLAIVTGRETCLIDTVKKKTIALDGIIKELGLSNQIHTYWGRLEDLAIQRRGDFSVLTARALSSLPSLLELASPLLKERGHLICFKGMVSSEELNKALSLEKKTGMKLISNRGFTLPESDIRRTILVFEKSSQPTMKLPRKVGLAQKKPLA